MVKLEQGKTTASPAHAGLHGRAAEHRSLTGRQTKEPKQGNSGCLTGD
jgi:hypothetical protein